VDLPPPTFGPPPELPLADASVRAARATDADGMGQVQAAAWRASYDSLLPADLLSALDPAELADVWRAAVGTPPSRAHRVLVALGAGEVVGFAATGPSAGDPPEVGELLVLLVAPGLERQGHGSRLLNAAADQLRQSGFDQVVVWVPVGDSARLRFLTGAGFVADGAHRALQLPGTEDKTVSEQRLVASLTTPE
jgi:GNAT superfamily N-acetyltransferase